MDYVPKMAMLMDTVMVISWILGYIYIYPIVNQTSPYAGHI